VLEKNDTPGGRARQLWADGFTFDMGPSWYWMPDVFERFFSCFGKKVSDYYELKRLDPSYSVYWQDEKHDIPANYEELKNLFEKIESGSAARLDLFMKQAEYKYNVGMNRLVYKPGRSLSEFMDLSVVTGVLKLDVFTSMKKHIRKFFKDPKLQQLMEFPVLFLGAEAKDIPALYSLMNYADTKLGTWYPMGGMYKIVEGMYSLAKELGVKFYFGHEVVEISCDNGLAKGIAAKNNGEKLVFDSDVVVGAADYHFIENKLLSKEYRNYSEGYWDSRVMAPSCLLYYVGLNKKVQHLSHHTLFFDTFFEQHAGEIYKTKQWPTEPLFYVSAPSVTDPSVAPADQENLFFLIPVAAGLQGDTEELRNRYFEKILSRFEKKTGTSIKDSIIFKQSYSLSDFVYDYNAFRGNAYGLANTLKQTAVLKPSVRSRKVKNLFFAGQLTVPGPGVPPSLISGEVAAKQVVKYFGKQTKR
jgi:phytoene desaturase